MKWLRDTADPGFLMHAKGNGDRKRAYRLGRACYENTSWSFSRRWQKSSSCTILVNQDNRTWQYKHKSRKKVASLEEGCPMCLEPLWKKMARSGDDACLPTFPVVQKYVAVEMHNNFETRDAAIEMRHSLGSLWMHLLSRIHCAFS